MRQPPHHPVCQEGIRPGESRDAAHTYATLGINPCCCGFCKGKYLEDTGAALPAQEDKSSGAWRRYFAWRRRLNTIILHEIIGVIRAANPKLTITHNGSGFARWSDIEFCDADDYVTHEFHYAGGYGRLALTCRKNQSLKPGVPFEIEQAVQRDAEIAVDRALGKDPAEIARKEKIQKRLEQCGSAVEINDLLRRKLALKRQIEALRGVSAS